jgi:hypothetical protein
MLADQRQKEVEKDDSFNSNTWTSSTYDGWRVLSVNGSESCTGTNNISIHVLTQSSHEKHEYTNISGTLESATQQRQEAAKAGRL